MLSANGKTKFSHWFYDIAFRNCVAVTVFNLGIVLSVVCPLMMPLVSAMLYLMYYGEKFNILYVYPLDFESKDQSRRILIVYSLVGVILFQFLMYTLVSFIETEQNMSIYLFAFLTIQVMILISGMEVTRKPWEG
jgi:hypothetical protein